MAILQLLLIAFCAVTSSLACTCMREHPQKQFCDTGFAVLAYVVSPSRAELMPNNPYPVPWKQQVYTVRIREIFKGHADVKTDRSYYAKLYTPQAGSSCRVTLKPRTYYVLFGKIVEGNLYSSFCNWRRQWKDLTREQLSGVRTLYSKGCECSMGFCFTSKCRKLLPGCEGFERRNVVNDCRAKYQRCERQISFNGERKCTWVGSKMCSRPSVVFP